MTSRDEFPFRNYSMWVAKKYDDDWFEWCVFFDGRRELLDRVESIEYLLHPTFPNPVRLVIDHTRRFPLFSSGWGTFTIDIEIALKDGRRVSTKHGLTLLEDDWPRKHAERPLPDDELERVYESLFHEEYRWRKTSTVARLAGMPVDRAVEVLRQLENDDLVRKSPFPSLDKADLWGATARVGVQPHV